MASPASSSADRQLQLVVHGGAAQQQQPEHLSVEYINEETVEVHYRGPVDGFLHSFPTGFRFAPRDDELLDAYLKNKVFALPMPPNCIKDVNIYGWNPSNLTVKYKPLDENDRVWYFFTPRDRKYPNGTRPDRAADNGYWKATGADKEIKHPTTGELLGTRKALVFYEGKPPNKGTKTNWIMHEYKLDNVPPRTRVDKADMKLDDCTLVKIYEKTDRVSKANGNVVTGQNDEVIFKKEPTPEIVENDISPKSNPSNDLSEEEGDGGGNEMDTEAIDIENAVGGVSRNPFLPSWNEMSSRSGQIVAPMTHVGNNNYTSDSLDSVSANYYQHHIGSLYHLESWHQAPSSHVIGQFDMRNDDVSIANHYQHHTGNTCHLESSHEAPSSDFIRQTGFGVKNVDSIVANHYQQHIGSTYHMESLHQAPSSNIIRHNSFEENYMSMNFGRYSEEKNDDSCVNFWLVDHPPSLPLWPSLPMTFSPSLPPNQ